ncbi:MAG: serine/threonine protein kinase, partial [Planktothrix sp.]
FTVVGTSGYAPLEQFWGRAVAASDLYALGATLIHLLTNTSPADLPQKNARIQFAERVSLNRNFVLWIEKMTEISLENRLPTAREALDLLEAEKIRPRINPDTSPQSALIQKFNQPFDSKISLNKTSQSLNIYIPPKGWVQLFKIQLGIFKELFACALIAYIPMFVIYLFYPMLFWFLCALTFAAFFLWQFFLIDEKTLVEFDHHDFRIIEKSRGIQFPLQSGSLGNIIGVFMEKTEYQYQVVIRTTSQTYRIGPGFTLEECAWLSQEIQDWLYP